MEPDRSGADGVNCRLCGDEHTSCRFCGNDHVEERCPRVAAVEYDATTGLIIRFEFVVPRTAEIDPEPAQDYPRKGAH